MAATEGGGAAAEMGKGVNQRARIRMSDAEIDEFLHGPHTMSLATLNADGTIHMVAMWYGFLEGAVAFETKAKSQKVANLRRNPTITCMVEDGTTYNELRGVQIVGTAEIFEERDRLLDMGKSLFDAARRPLHRRHAPRGRDDAQQARRHQGQPRPRRQLGPHQALSPIASEQLGCSNGGYVLAYQRRPGIMRFATQLLVP